MKKLLALTLILGMALAANAMTLDLQHGDADTVDLVATVGFSTGDDMYFAVVGDTSEVTISGGALGVLDPGPVPADSAIFGYDAQANGYVFAPLDGMWGSFSSFVFARLDPGVMIDEINWTLVGGATQADIVLYGSVDFMTPVELARITVPEPATLFLLALGMIGVRISRRKTFRKS